MSQPSNVSLSYRDAGVDIDAGDALVEAIKPLAKRTMREGVLEGHRRFRRAVRDQQEVQGAGAGVRHRRRRHQAQARVRAEPPRHGRHRPGRDERQRHPGAGRRAAVLPRLLRLRQARRADRDRRGRRHRQGLRAGRLRADRRRNGRNAEHVPGRRIRPGRLRRRRGGKIEDHRRHHDRRRRRRARPGLVGRALERLFAGAQDHRSGQAGPGRRLPRPQAGRRADGADPHLRQAAAGADGDDGRQGHGAHHRRRPGRKHPARAAAAPDGGARLEGMDHAAAVPVAAAARRRGRRRDAPRVQLRHRHDRHRLAKSRPTPRCAQLQAAGETVSRIGEIRARAGDEHQTIVN